MVSQDLEKITSDEFDFDNYNLEELDFDGLNFDNLETVDLETVEFDTEEFSTEGFDTVELDTKGKNAEEFDEDTFLANILEFNEELESNFFKDEKESEVGEFGIIQEEFLEELRLKGFQIPTSSDSDSLKVFKKRLQYFSGDGVSDSTLATQDLKKVIINYGEFCNDFSLSSSVLTDKEDKTLSLVSSSFVGGERVPNLLVDSIRNVIETQFSDDINFFVETNHKCTEQKMKEIVSGVQNILITSPKLLDLIYENYETFENTVRGVFYSIISLNRKILNQTRHNRYSKIKRAKYLTKDFLIDSGILDCIKGVERDSIHYVKQIKHSKGSYFCNCEVCGSDFEFSDFIATFIVYNQRSKQKFFVLPHVFSCDCGAVYCFPQIDIDVLSKALQNSILSNIKAFMLRYSNISRGTSLYSYDVSIKAAQPSLSYLIFNEDDFTKPLQITSNSGGDSLTQSTNEYRNAVTRFYSMLKLFDHNAIPKVMKSDEIAKKSNVFAFDDLLSDLAAENTQAAESISKAELEKSVKDVGFIQDHLDFKELAIYFCKMLSLDYNVTKNKAFFSLLISLKENSLIAELIDFSKIYRLGSLLKFLDLYEVLPAFDVEQFTELKILACQFVDADTIEGILDLQNDTDGKESLLKILKTVKYEISSKLKSLEKNSLSFVRDIQKFELLLGHTKIVNITQTKLLDFLALCKDTNLYASFDRITDRMICYSYAEEFYEVYKTFNIFSKSSLRAGVEEKASGHIIGTAMRDKIDAICELDGSLTDRMMNRVDLSNVEEILKLKKLGDSFKKLNFYNFSIAICELNDYNSFSKILDGAFLKPLRGFFNYGLEAAKKFTSDWDSQLSYVFQEFEVNEINELFVDFPEIFEKDFEFPRFVPKREKGESAQEFAKRFLNPSKTFVGSGWDSAKPFYDFKDFFCLLFSLCKFTDAEYHSYTKFEFVVQLVNLATDRKVRKKSSSKDLLGINDEISNLITWEVQHSNFSIDTKNVDMMLKMHSGVYMTSLEKEMDIFSEELSRRSICVSDNLAQICNSFNSVGFLEALVSRDEESFAVSDGAQGENDYEEAINELILYTGYSALGKSL